MNACGPVDCRRLAGTEHTGELRSAFANRLCEVQGLERMELLLTLWLRPGVSSTIKTNTKRDPRKVGVLALLRDSLHLWPHVVEKRI